MSILARLGFAVIIALAISFIARRARALTISGATAATITGTLAVLAGWRWALMLVIYFASASALSRLGARKKEERTRSIIEKGGERDALQVVVNGGVFALAAALALLLPDQNTRWLALGTGALAASASDTWATEIGTLAGGTPRSIIGFQPLAVGMSGGVTIVGTIAAFCGAGFIALVALGLSWPPRIALAAVVSGVLGSTIDSLLGATVQQRRWCERCNRATERVVHDCGTSTRPARGITGLTNDMVNLICGMTGGLVALALSG